LEEFASLCSSSLVPHCSSFGEGTCNSGVDNTMLANTSMVSSANTDGSRLPTGTPRSAQDTSSHSLSQLQLSGSHQTSSIGRMEGLREQFQAESTSERAIGFILASWRDKTNSTYNSAWCEWERWCSSHDTDPFSANIANILQFLTEEFEAGREYRSLNCYCSAISSTHLPVHRLCRG
jgi:hypothetical protein